MDTTKSKIGFLEMLTYYLESGYQMKDSLELLSVMYPVYYNKMVLALSRGHDIYNIFNDLKMPKEWLILFYFFNQSKLLEQAIRESLEIYKEKQSLKHKLVQKMTYPFILILFCSLMLLFMSYFLLPQMLLLSQELDIESSLLKYFLWFFSQVPTLFMNGFIVLFFIIIILLFTSITSKSLFDYLMLHTPFIKSKYQYYITNRFVMYYCELLLKGITNSEIIHFLATQNQDKMIQRFALIIQLNCKKGESIKSVLQDQNFFLSSYKDIISVSLTIKDEYQVLNQYLKMIQVEFERKIEHSIKLILPIIFCVIGGVMIFIYLSFLIPMTSVIDKL